MDDYEINDRMQRCEKAPINTPNPAERHSKRPPYYGTGKIWDMYKYADAHKMRPAVGHALKYMTRAGKKKGETYEESIWLAIGALQRDLEIYNEEKENLSNFSKSLDPK